MYTICYWNRNQEFEEIEGGATFTLGTKANDAALDRSTNCDDTIYAVIEDGLSKPYSLFFNGRHYKIVEWDE